MNAQDPQRRGRRRGNAVRTMAAIALAALAIGAVGVLPAAADGPTTFSNTTAIAIPAAGSPSQIGPASPYPSSISVSGMTGLVTKVTVSFAGLTHAIANDIDALLVAPTGQNLLVMSDASNTDMFTMASNATLTFDDAAAGPLPGSGAIATGTYRPTNNSVGAADAFPAPAPSPSAQTTFAGAFTGINPNGAWQLFIVDDATGDLGSMSGGWSLSITTEATAVATTTAVTSSGTPSVTGTPVTLTASVAGGGAAVTVGSVQFSDGVTPIGAPVPLDASGHAQLVTSALSEGTHLIRATYSGAPGFLTSNGTVSQRVDNPTVVTGSTYCNTGAMTIPSGGSSSPYPSNVTVSGLAGPIVSVTATVNGFAHEFPVDVDIMLSAPSPSNNLILMSDAGGNTAVSGVNLTFDDAAASGVAAPLVSGTYRPTNVTGDDPDLFPAPAPSPSGATTLATFAGTNPNGTWSLWVVDNASGDAGSIAGGWCLTVVTQQSTATALTSSVNPSDAGASVTFTATVTAGGSAVTAGTVQFADSGSPLGAAVPVAADGTATLTTSALTVGTHPLTATYSGTAALAGSSGSVSQVVQLVSTSTTLVSSVNPSDAGASVTFTATVTAGGSAVTAGTVQFADSGSPLGAPVPVAADGTATLATSALTAGTHPLTATYSGTPTLSTSDATLTQTVAGPPTPDAGGPYTVAEGDEVSLDGSGTVAAPGATFEWDVNGDGTYGDASGATPTLTWPQLEALGIDDGPSSRTVSLRVTAGSLSATDSTTLQVTNTAPSSVVTGALTATAGIPFTVKVGADDPSSADMAAMFTYTVDWGDGSPVETVVGPSDPPVTHTYTAAGAFSATFTAEDKDGGVGGGTVVEVQVAAAPSPSPSPDPTPTSPAAGLPPTGADVSGPLALGGLLLLLGAALVVFRRVPRRS